MTIDITNLRRYIAEEMIFATNHAAERFRERGIGMEDIHNAIANGENMRGEKIHVVLSDNGNASKVITAYYPDVGKWSEDFKLRR